MEESEAIYITHYFNTPLPKGKISLKILTFLSSTKKGLEEKFYFMGYDFSKSFFENEIKYDIISGALVRLPAPVLVSKGKSLWMDIKGVIYIADKRKPHSDLEKKAIYDSKTKNSLI